MAGGIYTSVGGVRREVKELSVGAGGVKREVSEGWTGVSGVKRQFYSAAKIYGVEWDGSSKTTWTRTDAAKSFPDPVPYVAGATKYGSPFDDIMPWAGMKTVARTGGMMVEIPRFWYHLESFGSGGLKIQIANEPTEGFETSPAHIARKDGQSERSVVYVGRYHCDGNYTSSSGVKPFTNKSLSYMGGCCSQNGSNYMLLDFATLFTIWLLYLVEFADWDSQARIGYGCGNSIMAEMMGYTDSMPYHTGTMRSSRTEYGVGTQYRYIEGLWDNVYDWIAGCYYNTYGLYIILDPAYLNSATNGKFAGKPSDGYPSAFAVSSSGGFTLFYPTESQGSNSTYSCDSWEYASKNGSCFYNGGGYVSRSLVNGLFAMSCTALSSWSEAVGFRLLAL